MINAKSTNNLKRLRIEKGYPTMSSFTAFLNINNGNYSMMENGTKRVSSKVKQILMSEFPEYNIDWIVQSQEPKYVTFPAINSTDGQGSNGTSSLLLIPFYNTISIGGHPEKRYNGEMLEPEYYMNIPEFSGCYAFRAYTDCMANLIQPGNILLGKPLESWRTYIEYGQIYSIFCSDGRYHLRYIIKSKATDRLRLKAENRIYESFELDKDSIRSIWLIEGWLNKRL